MSHKKYTNIKMSTYVSQWQENRIKEFNTPAYVCFIDIDNMGERIHAKG